MFARVDPWKTAPGALKALRGVQEYVNASGLEGPLMELVKIRASQINGCAFCLDMHFTDARAAGESQTRLDLVGVWREAESLFTPRERAALAWTEAVTLIARDQGVPDAVYNEVRKHFSDKELVDLNVAVIAINSWNRMAITFQSEPRSLAKAKAA